MSMHTNRLINEKSPYLLQHANNPVDWYPWGAEAFGKAREEDKPIFLSVGYSTCHWCHVMERESFENDEIAEILNRLFVPIKVDREERPDVDRVYMTFVQATTGGGGWPMSVWLTPELKPFLGGTYFPPETRWGRTGFREVLERISEAWRVDREKIVDSSNDVILQLQKQTEVESATPGANGYLDQGVLDSGFFSLRRSFDTRLGGFGPAPKFPRPSVFNFLFRYYHRTGNQEALEMGLKTLQEMATGGMNDQLGGGFHRYSVDERWLVPHFEKMLYDQAQLAVSYLEAFQITHDQAYADVARTIFDYVLRDMHDRDGGFYSAEDADSVIDPGNPAVKGEGAYYVWTKPEIQSVAGQPAADWFCYRFGVEEGGNVDDDPHGEFTGKNILYVAHSLEETAQNFGKPAPEIEAAIQEIGQKLLALRSNRVRPQLDDKILTAWNGLMISALAKGGAVLGEPAYADAARRAADFLIARAYDEKTGVLLRRYRQGEAAIPGFLDDYAFFIQAMLDLYESQFDIRHLGLAVRLAEKQSELFEDLSNGAFYSTATGDDSLVMRIKDGYDGAEPSGNSIAVLNLLRLAEITNRRDFRESAERTMAAFASRIREVPIAVPQMLTAYEFSLAGPKQIVLVGENSTPEMGEFLQVLHERFVPARIVLLVEEGEARQALIRYIPAVETMERLNGRPTAYVCENYTCKLPTSDARKFAELLQ